ncbi:ABC transporter ATP-binding protein, partial [candidate division WOR-3 bacterium]|nr:ABC transporter ATP-binding protein [candidate division WOR-3 bacterium]
MSCAVEVRNVSVSYHEHLALHDVSLELHRGDFLGIIGPNGAGKTTLLTVMNGLGRIRGGTVRVFDRPAGPADFGRLRRRIGYVPQHLDVDPRAPVSCFESVLIGRYGRLGLLRRPGEEDRRSVEELLQLTGTAHLKDRPVGRVSGGEARKLALARALVQEPELLLLDEPTANLDTRAVREILDLITGVYRRLGLTVAMVTHQLDHLPGACNRVVLMKQTRVLFAGPRELGLTPE